MSTSQLEGLWQYILSLNLSTKNRKWLADKLIELNTSESESLNATTIAAIEEAKESDTTSFDSFDDFKKHIYEL